MQYEIHGCKQGFRPVFNDAEGRRGPIVCANAIGHLTIADDQVGCFAHTFPMADNSFTAPAAALSSPFDQAHSRGIAGSFVGKASV
jgi:hypothetical protein